MILSDSGGLEAVLPNFIFEGAEGTGKSTAARILAEKFGYRVNHFGPPDDSLADGDAVLTYYELVAENQAGDWVWDRGPAGELAYGPVFRGGSRITIAQLGRFLSKFRKMGGVHVLMNPAVSRIASNFKNRAAETARKAQQGDDIAKVKKALTLSKILLVQAAYVEMAEGGMFDVVEPDFITLGRLCDIIKKFMINAWSEEEP